MELPLDLDDEALAEFCRRYHIQRLAFFGSILREDFSPESDIDVLIEFEPGREPGLGYFLIEEELSELLGRPVDLNTPGFLSRYIRERVQEEAVERYVAT